MFGLSAVLLAIGGLAMAGSSHNSLDCSHELAKTNRLEAERNKIEKEKLKQQKISNQIKSFERYNDSDLVEKLNNVEREIEVQPTTIISGGAGMKELFNKKGAKTKIINPNYTNIKNELTRRGVDL